MEIRQEIKFDSRVVELLQQHMDSMQAQSPPESVHALDLDELRAPGITLWTVWEGLELLGCGAIKELDKSHGEIKSMRTAENQIRKGVASALLKHMLDVAAIRGYQRLSLETGSMITFEPARQLYEHFGFKTCDPFADYDIDPNSVFMSIKLS